LTRTSSGSRSSAYSIPEPRTHYKGSKESSYSSAKSSTIDENKASSYSARRRNIAGVQSTYTNTTLSHRPSSHGDDHHSKDSKETSLGSKKRELAVDLENQTITSELTDLDSGSKVDRTSASSSLRDLTKYASGRARSNGRARSTGRRDSTTSSHLSEKDSDDSTKKSSASAITSQAPRSADSKLSNLDLARTFLNGSAVANSRARSRSRSRLPQDRDTFDDSKSVGGQSFGGASIYNDNKSRSKGFGGKYDGDLNQRGERHGYGTFVADNGNEYEGEWKNDKREGHGKAKYNTGDVYIGNWKNCKRHRHGTMYIENGDVYEGGWNNGFKDGPGTYRWKDGEVDLSRYSSDYRVGEGVRWSEDRTRAFRLVRGNVQEEIDLGEADRIADSLGLSPP